MGGISDGEKPAWGFHHGEPPRSRCSYEDIPYDGIFNLKLSMGDGEIPLSGLPLGGCPREDCPMGVLRGEE